MSEAPKKNYISGSAKARETQYGEILNLSLKLEDLQKIVNEKGFVNLTVSKRKEVGQYGDTHTVTENTWKPEQKPTTNGYTPSISDTEFPF